VRSVADEIASTLGDIGIVVNNAGISIFAHLEMDDDEYEPVWHRAIEVMLASHHRVVRACLPQLRRAGNGRIINIASGAGRRGTGGFAHYSASKAAAINVSQAFALKLAEFNINVNCICPGLLWTPLWEKIAERDRIKSGETVLTGRQVFDQRLETSTPLGREQTPEDVGKLAAFLASDRSKNITGQSINLNGGSYMN
jgi:NAD(P)-dependent dehydrogenase (short-subunit alcohol dehydrogenase family)